MSKKNLIKTVQPINPVQSGIVSPPLHSKGKEEFVVFGVRIRGSAKQQFAVLAAEEGRKQQELLAEALNDFFAKKRKPQIA